MDIVSLFANATFRDIGATALLTIVVILILLGRLQPKSVADAWKNAYFTEQASGREKEKQITLLASSATVSARVLDALPLTGGDSDDVEETTETRRRRRQG